MIAVVAGLIAGSTALVGFGFDSLIEVTSGVALLWRLHADVDEDRRERVEAIGLRIVGWREPQVRPGLSLVTRRFLTIVL